MTDKPTMRNPALCHWSNPVESVNPINGKPCDAWSDCARPAESDGLCARHADAVGRVIKPFLDRAVEAATKDLRWQLGEILKTRDGDIAFSAEAARRDEREQCAQLVDTARDRAQEQVDRGPYDSCYDVKRELVAMVSVLNACGAAIRARGAAK